MDKPPPRPEKRPPEPPPPPWASDPDGLLKSRPGSVRLALTGGVASGKSTVAELFRAFGAEVIDFDLLAREALAPGGECLPAAAALFGPRSVLKDGTLDRAWVARRIFKDDKLREALEAEVHPYTWRRMLSELSSLREAPVIVVDVPLLFEARLNTLFRPTVLCFASAATQLRRLRERNPDLSGREAKRVIRSQLPPAEKLRLADCVVSNDGPLRETIRQAKALWDRLSSPDALTGGCRGGGGPGPLP
ncbi:MAG: dephospho-CoA kinase [Deltaproteobacteria bacterium]|jgi:dephospho-CoA kinase|nr:dephospho-CoA kinase [Deltaproteobacteria bacterium]